MNGSACCHEIEGVDGLYVDAFRGSFLRKTADPSNAFILTHYHGDHYGSLPRDGKYQGPALIRCTPVTAALIRNVHKVPASFVVQHDYGETWRYRDVRITFYDANHCPGAAIVTIQLPDGTVHLHTGDMRYHPKMKTYPVLREAVRNRKLDLLYLDTTYGHPKHDFGPQEQAVDSIATQIHDLLSAHGQCGGPQDDNDPNQPKVLILLSCYSIGKEKVLWESAQRTNQLVHVTDKKMEMLKCLTATGASTTDNSLPCHQMVERCTRDPDASDLHVIRMGLAGELWPYFRPNYRNCVDYEEELTRNYDKVVAFLPTGWANGSNWNKKNAISQRQLTCRKSERTVDVEIRLIPYSEHSACHELESFVEYCRPRKVVPTVFSDANDCRRLEQLFRKYVDTSRAKLQFFKGMTKAASAKVSPSPAKPCHSSDHIKPPAEPLSNSGVSNDDDKKAPANQEAALRPKTQSETKAPTQCNPPATGGGTIDLTLSSDDDEDEKKEDTTRPLDRPKENNAASAKVPTTNSRAKATTPSKPSSTPAKRRLQTPTSAKTKNKKGPATPPITNFFAVTAKRK